MTPLPPGHFRLVPFVEPPVPAGSYLLTGATTGMPGEVAPMRARVRVESPRYALPPDQVLSTFPPAGARGAFTSRLPQIVLRRRTLPWERSTDLDGDVTTTPTPWLALVLIAEGEGQLLTDVPVGDCTTAGVDLGPDADVPKGACLEVPQSVVDAVFPPVEDLSMLCHVREVDLADTELALGDDDGWLAVVLGNRLPQPGVRYLACLVNLEGQYGHLPEVPDESLVITYLPVERVVDLRPVPAATGTVGMDSALMGLPLGPGAHTVRGAGGELGPEVRGTVGAAAQRSIVATPAAGPAASTGAGWAAASAVQATHVAADLGLAGKLALSDGFALGPLLGRTLRFPVLAHWSFTCEERGDFQYLATNVHVRMLGHVVQGAETPDGDPVGSSHPVTPGNAAQPGVTRPLPVVAETGHVRLHHVTRAGEEAPAWFRGPLVPAAVPRAEVPPPDPQPLAHHADQLRRVVPDGCEDLGYAAAFEIGRLLALSQPGVAAAMSRWRQEAFGAARVSAVVEQATTTLPPHLHDALARPDPLAGPDDMVRAHTVGARALRALVDALGEQPDALGAPRPVADPGAAAQHLARMLDGGQSALLAGLAVEVEPTEGAALLDAVTTALVRVAAPDGGAVDAAVLRTRLEDAVGAVAADVVRNETRVERAVRGRGSQR